MKLFIKWSRCAGFRWKRKKSVEKMDPASQLAYYRQQLALLLRVKNPGPDVAVRLFFFGLVRVCINIMRFLSQPSLLPPFAHMQAGTPTQHP
jgi:hypothetical protein